MDAAELPDAQREVYEYLLSLGPSDPAPTIRGLGRHFGVAQSGIQCRLRSLRGKGLVTWVDGEFRTLRAIRPGYEWALVPTVLLPRVQELIGEVAE